MTTLKDVKNNPQILEFIKQTEKAMAALSYTNHGIRHTDIVADRAMQIAKEIGLDDRTGELAAIAGFCHDMGNFLSRHLHNYLAAVLFHQVFNNDFEPVEMAEIIQAISKHDKDEMNFTSPVAALVVLADKSDVHRSRVLVTKMEDIKSDIHDRVNYATEESSLRADKKKKTVTLELKIDVESVSIMEYFEIFTERMVFCRKAAQFLGYQFGIIINDTTLL